MKIVVKSLVPGRVNLMCRAGCHMGRAYRMQVDPIIFMLPKKSIHLSKISLVLCIKSFVSTLGIVRGSAYVWRPCVGDLGHEFWILSGYWAQVSPRVREPISAR